jgi:hypothetical protein
VQGFPGAAVLDGVQLCFGLLGAFYSGGEVVFGVAEGVAECVAAAELEVVQVAGRDIEGGFEVEVFFGQVVGVEAVEQDGLVAGVGEQGFPGLVALPRGLDEDDPGSPLAEVHAAQHGFLVAFDVDFQEVDGSALGVLFADGGQGVRLHGVAAYVHAGVFTLLGDGGFKCRQTGVGDAVERQVLGVFAGDALQVGVFGALFAQGLVVIGDGLDVDAGPAMVIKSLGDRVVDGIVGAYIDVEAIFDVSEGAPQADVFEVLCVGNKRHGSRPLICSSS